MVGVQRLLQRLGAPRLRRLAATEQLILHRLSTTFETRRFSVGVCLCVFVCGVCVWSYQLRDGEAVQILGGKHFVESARERGELRGDAARQEHLADERDILGHVGQRHADRLASCERGVSVCAFVCVCVGSCACVCVYCVLVPRLYG